MRMTASWFRSEHGATMRRREFIAGVGATAVVRSGLVRAQSSKPIVGFINNGWAAAVASLAATFQKGLEETGFIDGQNVVIEHRWAEGDNNRLPGFVAGLFNAVLP